MSLPPDYPGRRRIQRTAAAIAGGDAYQGAFEAVGAVLIGLGAGYWVDRRWDTTPFGVIVGLGIGFAAMVLRLMRLSRELHPEATGAAAAPVGTALADAPGDAGDAAGFGEAPGLSDVLRDGSDDVWSETRTDVAGVAGKQDRPGSTESSTELKDEERES